MGRRNTQKVPERSGAFAAKLLHSSLSDAGRGSPNPTSLQ